MSRILRSVSTYVALAIGLVGLGIILYAWRLPPFASAIEMTENAYVRGQVTIIAPQLAGYVAEVPVQDFATVKKGDLLLRIDDRIFTQKLEQARAGLAAQRAALANSDQSRAAAEARLRAAVANVASAEAALRTAEANWGRIEPLRERGVVSQTSTDQSQQALDQARASITATNAAVDVARQDVQTAIVNRQSLVAAVEGAEAAVHLAEIDLSNTRITAPQDGRLGEIQARLGQYVSAGTQLMALVPNQVWVVANFKETQLAGMRTGQPVSFTVDALRHARLTGTIERFSPAAGSEFSVIRPENATGNFIKIAQRVPVRIAVDPGQPLAERLAPGMSVVVSVDTSRP
ncbi:MULTISPECIES: HlyD family secretion protein [Bosea]|uniref:HlyD family secretion protein n=1 Tax=Bosea TaxID=85413 RepID=UPI00214F8D1B|nr:MULTISPECIES: HlyD family secretion protein [Bosea]MCR4520199.1 HlyD family secretion protein [Bosea sp. 47.2.35]MDR6829765.1 multidrug resistance efflux pump [Bosea robiniae]MDR6896648.1 multidrug resistance efflux pump [Bosea sp. BE109]MDR7140046.1 multidrug resistance efflux pump [Bosea sp. BE168]MDR7176640.1 multidrug resistance efflux pump [Bosea sp. BE271]